MVENIRKPARLEFHKVHPTLTPATVNPGDVPPGTSPCRSTGRTPPAAPKHRGAFHQAHPGNDRRDDRRRPRQHPTSASPRSACSSPARASSASPTSRRKSPPRASRPAISAAWRSSSTARCYDAPTVKEEIDGGSASISGGGMTEREAFDLSDVLNNPLDLPLVVKQQWWSAPRSPPTRSPARSARR